MTAGQSGLGQALARQAVPGLWSSIWKLLRLRLVIFISGFRRAKGRRKVWWIIGMVFLAALLVGAFLLSWVLLRFLRSPQLAAAVGDIRPLLEGVPVLITAGAFLTILVTSFGVLLQALYLAGDMDFLLAAPVPIRAVFVSKLLQAILPNFSLICLFGLPVLFGLGAALGYNLLYYPFVVIVLAALALAAAGFSSLLVMLVVRIFPARRVAEVLGFLGAVLSFICSQSGQFARFSNVGDAQAQAALQTATRLNTPWSPLAWAGRGLVSLGGGSWVASLGYLAVTLGICAGAFGLALVTAEQLYYNGWANVQSVKRKKKAPRKAVPSAQPGRLTALTSFVPARVRAVVSKDFLVMRRDLRNMSQLVTPLILGIVYAIAFLARGNQIPAGRGEAPEWFMFALKNIFVYGNVAISLFVGWMLLARLAGVGFAQEGKNYWLLKAAPVSVSQLLAAKYLVAFLPAVVLGWAFLLVISLVQGSSLLALLYSALVVTLCVAGNTGLNLAFGVTTARMDWEDPRHMQRGGAGCLASLAGFIYLPVSLGAFFVPAVVMSAFGLPDVAGQAVGLLLGGGISLAFAIVPLLLVRNRVPLLGE